MKEAQLRKARPYWVVLRRTRWVKISVAPFSALRPIWRVQIRRGAEPYRHLGHADTDQMRQKPQGLTSRVESWWGLTPNVRIFAARLTVTPYDTSCARTVDIATLARSIPPTRYVG